MEGHVSKKLLSAADTSSCKKIKNVMQRNAMEKNTHKQNQDKIEQQKNSALLQMSKQADTVKEQLQRLKDEQRMTQYFEDLAVQDFEPPDVCHTTSFWCQDDEREDDEETFINPYPITFPKSSKNERIQSASGSRVGFDDTEVTCSQVLPPLRRLGSNSSQFGQSTSCVPLSRSESAASMRSTSSSPRDNIEGFHWVGDPEAISSIRRSKKPIIRQSMDTINRSNSWKGGYRGRNKGLLARSKSWKERSQSSQGGEQETLSSSWNYKDRQSNDSVHSVVSQSDLSILHQCQAIRRSLSRNSNVGGSRENSCPSLRELSHSPETKSGVWGMLESDERNGAARENQPQSLAERRRQKPIQLRSDKESHIEGISPTITPPFTPDRTEANASHAASVPRRKLSRKGSKTKKSTSINQDS